MRGGDWTLWVAPDKWSDALWESVRQTIERQSPAKHPRTELIACADFSDACYLKIFFPGPRASALKDRLRQSKARRALLASAALAGQSFRAPVTLAAGEKRSAGALQCAFLLTLPVPGVSLPEFLAQCYGSRRSAAAARKHAALRQLARELRRFHDAGFVHGDLVPTNLFVARRDDDQLSFYFMDNDRTRRFPRSLPQSLWKRNLVQLNRMPMPGIYLQDRLRFLKAYLGARADLPASVALARWLEHKTRQRRWECERVESSGSFRALMRWNGEAVVEQAVSGI